MNCTRCNAPLTGAYCAKCGAPAGPTYGEAPLPYGAPPSTYTALTPSPGQLPPQPVYAYPAAMAPPPKKRGKVIAVVVVAVVVVLALVIGLFAVIFGITGTLADISLPDQPVTATQFESAALAAGYEVWQDKDGTEVLAYTSDSSIEFYECGNDREALGLYTQYEGWIEFEGGGSYTRRTVNVEQYSLYSLQSGGVARCLLRMDNTVLVLEASGDGIEKAAGLLESLGFNGIL